MDQHINLLTHEPHVFKDRLFEKHTSYSNKYNIHYASCQMQGRRNTMEDTYFVDTDLPIPNSILFGVFDGHGGNYVSEHCKYLFPGIFKSLLLDKLDKLDNKIITKVLVDTFLKLDDIFKSIDSIRDASKYLTIQQLLEFKNVTVFGNPIRSGTTAIITLITPTKIYTANAGDSRAILCKNDKVIELSHDHTPNLPNEYNRIIKAGETVSSGRISGGLNMSRAIGDYKYKSPDLDATSYAVIAYPDTYIFNIKNIKDIKFIVLVSDGVFESFNTNQELVTFISNEFKKGLDIQYICENVLNDCIIPHYNEKRQASTDNMTIQIILLK
jgi:serine/threonine protein phosphatase PrpC